MFNDKSDKSQSESANPDILFGRHPVLEALEQGRELEKVLLLQGTRGELEIRLRQYCKEAKIPLVMVPKEKLQRILPKNANHQGVAAFMPAISYQDLDEVLDQAEAEGKTPLLVLLDGVTDVRNLGAVARSAEAIGATALVLPKKGSAAVNGEAVKAAAGALHYLPVCRVDNLERCLDELHERGIRVAAADLRGEEQLFEADLSGPLALLFGGEDRGVRPHLLRKTDVHFRIPMRGKTDSFNVSVAAGICLYEVLRQQLTLDV